MRDLIIDCFAGGGGASVGIEMALGRPVDIAVNHDPQAIRMHKTNHPDTLHLTEDIFKVDLKQYVAGRHVALMWASPDCTSHSKAKGGQPRNKGLRILPWAVYKHAKAILPDVILMENVEEIQQWGPLNKRGYPIKHKRGKDYRRFIKKMYLAGYEKIQTKELVAADYGAPTTRKRWYAIFRRDGKTIVWPEPTHNKGGTDGLKKWEPIWKYLDLQDMGKSIFGRKKPLAEKTMNRIARGMEKFVFKCPEPFMVQVNHGGDNFRGQSIHEPMPTITGRHGFGVISPLLIQYHSETTKSGVRGQALTEPIQTIDTSNRYGLVMAFLTKFYKTTTGQTIWKPIHTITTSPGHFGQVSVLAIPKEELLSSIGSEADEMIQKCTWVSQFIMEYYGCGVGQSLNDPLHTIVTKDRFALVTVLGNEYAILDIFLRMLKPKELMLGQGFPADYIINRDLDGKPYPVGEQVARIGNSVVPIMAQALVNANCPYLKVGERMPNLRLDDSEEQLRFA
ncbi:DNA cytosine methyltransferase [[Clostridium] symbiosum]|uniref:DNA cytosine methyltransferase n=1 Tax=Clostridium symbiosum TaxID=1512 RepID=UPI00232D144D|nr:DNA cytosine methyltransferase [[Clostridium] symbiosum]MDB2011726.1 DNA cytosine methyltransferase [[Clostridium] symbiosum]MDB2028621.1 DNA cytosine methyltransferase [[Clostridium] symbiosum]